jgi:hypothetical protein
MDEPYAENFRDFQRLRGRPITPLPPPQVLPGLPPGLHAGDIPSVADLRASLLDADAAALHPEVRLWPYLLSYLRRLNALQPITACLSFGLLEPQGCSAIRTLTA